MMRKILPEIWGLLFVAAAAVYVSITAGCSPAAQQKVAEVVSTAVRVCRIAMANEPLISLAAERVGKPLDQYIAEACKVEEVVVPLVTVANSSAVCPVVPAATVAPYPWTSGIAGAPANQ